jgi:hypothetical protein
MNDTFFLFPSVSGNVKPLIKIAESNDVNEFMRKNIDKKG